MLESPETVYWDANVFLSYVNELPERMPVLDVLLEASSEVDGAARIYTSTLSQVEVAFAATEQAQRALDPQVERRINALWDDPDAVVTVEYHAAIGNIAKRLIRSAITMGWSLKPLDPIHLATAQWLSESGIALDEFHTYDRALGKYEALVDFRICEPYTPQPRMI